MGKFLLGLVTGVLLVFLTVVLLVFACSRFREKPPQIADNSVLVLRLEGDIPEKPPVELPAIPGRRRAGADRCRRLDDAKKAAADSRIKAIVLEPEALSGGWAKLEEMRADLEQFRKSGKPVFAYLRTPGAREYYLATGGRPDLSGPARSADAERHARGADVLQEDAG